MIEEDKIQREVNEMTTFICCSCFARNNTRWAGDNCITCYCSHLACHSCTSPTWLPPSNDEPALMPQANYIKHELMRHELKLHTDAILRAEASGNYMQYINEDIFDDSEFACMLKRTPIEVIDVDALPDTPWEVELKRLSSASRSTGGKSKNTRTIAPRDKAPKVKIPKIKVTKVKDGKDKRNKASTRTDEILGTGEQILDPNHPDYNPYALVCNPRRPSIMAYAYMLRDYPVKKK